MGMTLSILFGPGKVAPEVTPITGAGAILLLVFEYLYVREIAKRTDKPFTTHRAILTILVLSILLIPEVALILLASFLWPVLLPILAIYILVLAYILLAKRTNKDR